MFSFKVCAFWSLFKNPSQLSVKKMCLLYFVQEDFKFSKLFP